MNHRERFKALMAFEPVDRLPRIEWASYWNITIDRWKAEGLVIEGGADKIREHLGLDPYSQFWIGTHGGNTPSAPYHGAGIIRDEAGYREIHPTLYNMPNFEADRFQRVVSPAEKGDRVVWMSFDGFFWGPRRLLGIEPHLFAFYDQRELLHQINQDIIEFNLKALEQFCCKVTTPLFITLAEDMSYNHGPMLSETHFNEFLAPYYQLFAQALKQRGIPFIVDSDGDVSQLIPWLEKVGVNGILPLERMAGVDVAAIRQKHPHWMMIGGFDKTVMKGGEVALRAEFERLLPTMRSGGFIPSVDHQTPPDVSLDTYRTYLSLLQKYSEEGRRLN